MTDVGQTAAKAWSYYQAGDMASAERAFREVVSAEPNHADAWCLLGLTCRSLGKLDDAVDCYRRALQVRPDFAEVHNNLGNVLVTQKRYGEAVASYEAALRARPDMPQACNNLGVALRHQGKWSEAIPWYERAIKQSPRYPDAHNNLGDALQKLGRLAEAAASYRRALELAPDYPEAISNLGTVLARQGETAEAVRLHHRAIALRPAYADAHYNLGSALLLDKKFDEAIAAFRRSLEIHPQHPDALPNLLTALVESGRQDEAIAELRRATQSPPAQPELCSSLATFLLSIGQLDDAMPLYDRAIELKPDYPDAHMGRATVWLLRGDLPRGFAEYEWRWKLPIYSGGAYSRPEWDGAPLDGRSILIHAEQGLGDTIQFVRFARLVQQRGGRVIFYCPKALVRLLETCEGIDEMVAAGSKLPEYSLHAPLLSLPRILGTTLQSIPAPAAYLTADPQLVAAWRQRLRQSDAGAEPRFKVGIAWQGNRKYPGDRHRSYPLAALEPLLRLPGVDFVSLQKGAGSEQIEQLSPELRPRDLARELDESTGPFLDTAAVIRNLDLVITADTAIAHLAGALGARTWLALSTTHHWPWLRERSDSPWYPTMRLFRQQRLGDWQPVFQEMAELLQTELESRTPQIRIAIGPGELIDRLTILKIKHERMTDAARLANVAAELAQLESACSRLPARSELDPLKRELQNANAALWDIEDEIRDCERRGDFTDRFIELARSVYRTNDRRHQLKRRIDELFQYSRPEEKQYTAY